MTTRLPRQAFHLKADPTRVRRIMALARGGRTLAAQRAILRTIERWQDGSPR